ncbi:MAG: O-antigen ligase family protein [Gemmatimonadota bacterium]
MTEMPAAPLSTRRATAAAILLALGALAVVVAGAPSAVFDLERFILPKELVLHVTAAALLVVLPMRRPLRADTLDLLVGAFVAWGMVSSALAVNPWLAARGAGLAFSTAVVFMAARRIGDAGRGALVLGGLLAAAALAAAIGAAGAYGVDWIWQAESRAPAGSFGNRNGLAHFLAIATPAGVAVTLTGRRPSSRLLAGGVLALLMLTLVLTRSRAAWLGTAAGIGVTLPLLFLGAARPRLRRFVPVFVLMAVGAAAAVTVPNRLAWRSASPYAETLTGLTNYREGSGRGRLIQYTHSMELVREAPLLGVGPGNWFVHYPRVTKPGDPSFAGHLTIPTNPWPSSDWMALLAERGLPGALLVLLAGGAAAALALRQVRGGGARTWTGPAAGAAAAGTLVAAMVTGLFDAVLLLPGPAFLAAATSGVLLPRQRGRILPGSGPPLQFAALGLALTLVVLTGTWSAAIVRTATSGDRAALASAARLAPGEHRLRLLLGAKGGCAERLPHARAAVRLLPYHAGARAAVEACGG